MNFWDKITGSDITADLKRFETRAQKLPAGYQAAWEEIKTHFWQYSDFTGRNLMPILNNALSLLEETAADGLNVAEVFGGDIKAFCAALAGEEEAKSYRDKWQEQLNRDIARKLERGK